jgi:adenosine/AMP kinase
MSNSVTGTSLTSFIFTVDDLFKALKATSPGRFKLLQQCARSTNASALGNDELFTTSTVLTHEARVLEHGNVLLHGGETHGVKAREG